MAARRWPAQILLVGLVVGFAPFVTAPAAAGVDEVGVWYFSNRLEGGIADFVLYFGSGTDSDFARGDWDGDGVDDVARRGPSNVITLRNIVTGVERVIAYGKAGDELFFGDWDGDGVTTVAVRRGNVFYIKNSLTSGPADSVIGYGRAGDEVFVGDWDGDGIDTFAVRRGNVFFVKNSLTSGPADSVIGYGRPGDEVLVGDWDGDGIDTFAVRRAATIYVRNSLSSGPASTVFAYGRASDRLLAGDWDGDGDDTFVAQRPGPLPGEHATIYVPKLGEAVAVVGVRYDDTLPVRNGPGTDFGIIDGLDPLGVAEGTGEGWFRPDQQSTWWRVGHDSSVGWVDASRIARLGDTRDATDGFVNVLGGIPRASTMLELGNIVAYGFASDPGVPSTVTVVVAPTIGDLGEITLDVIGVGDDSVYGYRLVVFGTPDGAGYALKSVELTALCARGVNGGACI
jgi:hypothetical protein